MPNRILLGTVLAVLLVPAAARDCAAQKIEAVKGKQYRLTRQHGPWMIMVASFRSPTMPTKGMTPAEAADELVYELRSQGVPAYTFSLEGVKDELQTIDRYGRERSARFIAQQGSICVLAGNYPDPDDRVAQDTLAWIKEFKPAVLTGVKQSERFVQKLNNGGIVRKTPGRPSPLSGAFLTINPRLSPDEVGGQQPDPLLVQINSGMDHSLLDNPGRYTVVVASFYGQSLTRIGEASARQAERNFKVTNSLDIAARNAWELTRALRQGNFVVSDGTSPGKQKAFDAWVFHDRHRSIVTVGSFDSPNDPRILELYNTFKAKVRTKADTRSEFLAAEVLTIPPFPARGAMPDRFWVFDPSPTIMEVPRLR